MKTKAEEIIEPALLEWFNIDEQMEGIKFITRGKCLEAMEAYASQRDTEPKEEGKGAEEISDEKLFILFNKYSNCLGNQPHHLPAMTRSAFIDAVKELSPPANKPVTDDEIHRIATDYAYKRGGSEWYDALYAAVTFGAKVVRDGQIPKK